jgi:hypothetical protein
MNWKYADAAHTVAFRTLINGGIESCLVASLPINTQIDEYVAPPPDIVPVSPRQIRQALSRVGLRTSVEMAVASGDQDTKDWYEYGTLFERSHPQVIGMGIALGVSSSDLDNLWLLAATL